MNSKILKEKMKDEEGGVASLRRLTKLNFLSKFLDSDVQVLISRIIYKRLFLKLILINWN